MERPWVSSPSYKAAIDILVDIRKAKGLTQRDLGERIGKPHSFIAKIETRQRRLDIVEFIVLARALDFEPSDLIALLAASLIDPVVF